MAGSPTDLEAWTALLAHAAELDKVRKPKELKEHMYTVVSRTWNMSGQSMEYFVDFGVIWIDSHYRQLCNKMAEIGPGRETFDIATYRTLKTSRLDGVRVSSFISSRQISMAVNRFSTSVARDISSLFFLAGFPRWFFMLQIHFNGSLEH
jgi:hypothetical protein